MEDAAPQTDPGAAALLPLPNGLPPGQPMGIPGALPGFTGGPLPGMPGLPAPPGGMPQLPPEMMSQVAALAQLPPAQLAGLAAQLQARPPAPVLPPGFQMPPGLQLPGMPPGMALPGMPGLPPGLGIPGLPGMPGAAVTAPQQEVVVDCPQDLVGRVIGRGGETIRELQQKTGCSIQIDQKFPDGVPRKITVKGPQERIDAAKEMVKSVMCNGPSSSNMISLVSQPPSVMGPAVPGAALTPSLAAPAGEPEKIDPDVQDFCDKFQIEPKMARMLNDELHKRPDTWEGDLLSLYEILENARVPGGLLMVKIKEMQNGTFVGKPKPDKDIVDLGKKYKLDDAAVQRLTEVLKNREDRKGEMEKIERHLKASNKPSALVMMLLGKLRKGEDIGEPDFKPAPGSYAWEKEVRPDAAKKDRERGDRDRRSRDRDRDRDRDRRSRDRDRDRGRRSRSRDRKRSKSRSRDRRDKSRDRNKSRSRDRDRRRSKSKKKDRSRDRDRDRDKGKKSKSRDRAKDKDRSRSKDKDKRKDKSRSRDKDSRDGKKKKKKDRSKSRSKSKKQRSKSGSSSDSDDKKSDKENENQKEDKVPANDSEDKKATTVPDSFGDAFRENAGKTADATVMAKEGGLVVDNGVVPSAAAVEEDKAGTLTSLLSVGKDATPPGPPPPPPQLSNATAGVPPPPGAPPPAGVQQPPGAPIGAPPPGWQPPPAVFAQTAPGMATGGLGSPPIGSQFAAPPAGTNVPQGMPQPAWGQPGQGWTA